MTTQQPQEAAVGNESPVELSPEDRLNAAFDDPQNTKEPEEEIDPDAPPAEESELSEEDVTDDEEGGDDAQPPIAPPVSWTAEEKEEFKQLPRALQETLTRRESEREKFVQGKAQEVKQVEARVHAQMSEQFQNVAGTFAQQIGALRVELPPRPSHQLQAEDPYTYAEQMDAYERAAGHNQWVDRTLANVGQQVQQAQQADLMREQQVTLAVLTRDFPDYLDSEKGPEIRQRLGSTAQKLGYSEEQINAADHHDIIAMRTATDWREKAEKYDRLMAKKMERVREAKNLPRVSRPGTAQAPGAARTAQYAKDREAMRNGDNDAARRAIDSFFTQSR